MEYGVEEALGQHIFTDCVFTFPYRSVNRKMYDKANQFCFSQEVPVAFHLCQREVVFCVVLFTVCMFVVAIILHFPSQPLLTQVHTFWRSLFK